MPLKNYLIEHGHTEEEAEEIYLEYEMILRIVEHPNNLYDIVSWLGWFDEDQEGGEENEADYDQNRR